MLIGHSSIIQETSEVTTVKNSSSALTHLPGWAMQGHPFSSTFVTPVDSETQLDDSNNGGGREADQEAICEWDITLSTVVCPGMNSNAVSLSDALGVTEFDPTGRFLVTGGSARKIRLYAVDSLLPCDHGRAGDVTFLDHGSAGASRYMFTPAKLSSLKWKPHAGGRIIGSGDYDGVVMEYDLETRLPVYERDEHGGRRIWSIDYSQSMHLGASGSDEGSLQLWDSRCADGKSVAAVWPSRSSTSTPSSVCCVEFEPMNGSTIAVGCADKKAYMYDARMMARPMVVLEGHTKTVTYVKFLDDGTLVTSSVDGQLKLWNLDRGMRPVRSYTGHQNSRNFVGLSVWRHGGLLVCGSESNQVFVYDKRWSKPIWVHGHSPDLGGDSVNGIVCSVAWRQEEGAVAADSTVLAAGGSDGLLHVFRCVRK